VQTTSHALATANDKIAGLQQRVSALEAENAVLRMMFAKLNVIAVSPDGKGPPDGPEPPPDDDPPPTLHLEPRAA
jgi:hypothetical protein